MKTTNSAAAVLAAALLTLAGAGRASADLMQVSYESRGAGIISTIQYNHQNVDAFIGQFNMKVVGGQAFESFCVDPTHDMHPGATITVQPRSTDDGLHEGPQIAYLYNTYGQSVLSDNHAAAGLQIAIWELLVDGLGDGLSSGNIQYNSSLPNFDPTAYNDALFYLGQAASHTSAGTWLDATPSDLLGNPGQSVLFPSAPPLVPQTDPVRAPEPTSALLVGLGLTGLAVWRRRKRLATFSRRRGP
jgi:hypothetical protein